VHQRFAEAIGSRRHGAESGAQVLANGNYYTNGWGVTKDYAEALRWYRKAADQGDAGAQYALSLAYANGRGTSPDLLQARVWMEKAAAGDEAAMDRLAGHKLDAGDAPSALLFDQQRVDMARRAYVDDPSDAAKSDLAVALGNLSFVLELNNRPADALAASDEALKLDPSALWIAANRAHVLLLLGRYDEAKAIYIEDKTSRYSTLRPRSPQRFSRILRNFANSALTTPR
jgi:TPR repeat protein